MPEVILCIYCDKPLYKTKDEYVLVRKATDVAPEALVDPTQEKRHRALRQIRAENVWQ
jgi:hypothetical protein